MAIYTTFFLCTPAELPGGFPGWRLPLAKPVRRKFRNPLTGASYEIETREPEWSEDERLEPDNRYSVTEIEGSYEDYLEGRSPPFVRARPHWAAKGLTEFELNPLLEIVGAKPAIESALYAPPSRGAFVQQFPSTFLAKLLKTNANATAKKWAAAMSQPEFTHSVAGKKLNDGWTTEEALGVLRELVALAREAGAKQRLYLLIET